MTKLVMGVGINDGKYPMKALGEDLREYKLWQNLLARCCSPKTQQRQPTYFGCSVSENFKNYSYFYEWCQNQVGFGQKGFQLDKDLILRGNRLYSEDRCLFLPQELNKLIASRTAIKGQPTMGVSAHQGKFVARCRREPAPYYLGIFGTIEEAFSAYKQAKEAFIKAQAEKWKDQIDIRAYEALMRYEVLPTD